MGFVSGDCEGHSRIFQNLFLKPGFGGLLGYSWKFKVQKNTGSVGTWRKEEAQLPPDFHHISEDTEVNKIDYLVILSIFVSNKLSFSVHSGTTALYLKI